MQKNETEKTEDIFKSFNLDENEIRKDSTAIQLTNSSLKLLDIGNSNGRILSSLMDELKETEKTYAEHCGMLLEDRNLKPAVSVIMALHRRLDCEKTSSLHEWACECKRVYSPYIQQFSLTCDENLNWIRKRPLVRIRYFVKLLKRLALLNDDNKTKESADMANDLLVSARTKMTLAKNMLAQGNLTPGIYFDKIDNSRIKKEDKIVTNLSSGSKTRTDFCKQYQFPKVPTDKATKDALDWPLNGNSTNHLETESFFFSEDDDLSKSSSQNLLLTVSSDLVECNIATSSIKSNMPDDCPLIEDLEKSPRQSHSSSTEQPAVEPTKELTDHIDLGIRVDCESENNIPHLLSQTNIQLLNLNFDAPLSEHSDFVCLNSELSHQTSVSSDSNPEKMNNHYSKMLDKDCKDETATEPNPISLFVNTYLPTNHRTTLKEEYQTDELDEQEFGFSEVDSDPQLQFSNPSSSNDGNPITIYKKGSDDITINTESVALSNTNDSSKVSFEIMAKEMKDYRIAVKVSGIFEWSMNCWIPKYSEVFVYFTNSKAIYAGIGSKKEIMGVVNTRAKMHRGTALDVSLQLQTESGKEKQIMFRCNSRADTELLWHEVQIMKRC